MCTIGPTQGVKIQENTGNTTKNTLNKSICLDMLQVIRKFFCTNGQYSSTSVASETFFVFHLTKYTMIQSLNGASELIKIEEQW